MRVLIVNSVCGYGSTGRICVEIANNFKKKGHLVKIAYGRHEPTKESIELAVRIGNKTSPYFSALKSRLLDNDGLNCKKETKDFLKWADSYNPDLLWLHNLHDHYINFPLLFAWIKSRPQMIVKWTLHDCWSFTGHCSYFTYCGCNKWKFKCSHCPQKKSAPKSLFLDQSSKNYEIKKACFTGVKNMTLITPSKWLADLTKESFLKEYNVEIVPNTIDTNVFHPIVSDFRTKHGFGNKKIILGVAMPWNERKGLKDFLILSSFIEDDMLIVLVGVTKKQRKNFPKNVFGIDRVSKPSELAEIYSSSNVFFNPTYEDNYPTTNLEAQACGTPCVTYKTGGSPESVPDKNVVSAGDVKGAFEIMKLLFEREASK